MKKHRPYTTYKPSGIEWLDEIPEHWEVRRLKHVASTTFSNVDKNTVEGERPICLCNYVDVYYHDYITPDIDFMKATATSEEIARFTLKKGDVILTKDTGIAASAYVTTELTGVLCGYHLAQVRARSGQMDGEYLFRAFQAGGINDQFRVAATGITIFGLGKYWLDNALMPVPPLDEQRAIAAYLNRETSRIDALIEKIKKSIDLLQEYRIALITAAVIGKIDVREEVST